VGNRKSGPNEALQQTAAAILVSRRLLFQSHFRVTDMDPSVIRCVCLRDIAPDDLPWMYEFNLDPEANRLAATIPRSAEAFRAHWERALADPSVVAKAIYVDDLPLRRSFRSTKPLHTQTSPAR
jgi:hypothetical protein